MCGYSCDSINKLAMLVLLLPLKVNIEAKVTFNTHTVQNSLMHVIPKKQILYQNDFPFRLTLPTQLLLYTYSTMSRKIH